MLFRLVRIKFFKFEVLRTSPNKILINRIFNKHILNIEAIKIKYSFNFASKKKLI